MAKNTITVEWEGVLRLQTIEINRSMVALNPTLIGLAAEAIITPGGNLVPIELILTPIQAAAILDMFSDLREDGHIPIVPHGAAEKLRRQ